MTSFDPHNKAPAPNLESFHLAVAQKLESEARIEFRNNLWISFYQERNWGSKRGHIIILSKQLFSIIIQKPLPDDELRQRQWGITS